MNASSGMSPYRNEALQQFSSVYSSLHGYISLIICAIGIALNIINISVLTRKHMLTPVNYILTWLAVSDMATMVSYVPFAYHFYCRHSATSMSSEKNSLFWMTFLLVYLNFSSITHTISIWLAVALAMFRHHHIHSPAKGNITRMRRIVRARLAVGIIVCASIILMIPNYLSHKLEEKRFSNNTTGYVFEDWEIVPGGTKLISLILYSSVAKLLPCVLIIIFGGLLLKTLRKTKQHRRYLSANGISVANSNNKDPSRTTVMLLIVIVLFLVTELPQGVLILCCIFLKNFFENIYIPLGDAMDILALTNNCINFVLYCTMSREFRQTFVNMFCSCLSRRKSRKENVLSQHNNYCNTRQV